MEQPVNIEQAVMASDLQTVRHLFEAYAVSLPIDLGYQDFGDELTSLPGKYARPAGVLLLARRSGDAIGCVAMRPMQLEGACEMKRLYVTPEGRGSGAGKALASTLILEAKSIGYREMYLDTLPSMGAAQSLYRALGFERTAAYYPTPIADTAFYRLTLA